MFRLCSLFTRPDCCLFVNYRFSEPNFTSECPIYVTESRTRTGCLLPYESKTDRFKTFYTLLQDGNSNHRQELELKSKGELIKVPGWHNEFEHTMVFFLRKWKTMLMCNLKSYLYFGHIFQPCLVKLNPPINLTVQMGSDSNLWYYWNQTSYNCVENEVRIRTNGKKWDVSKKLNHLSNKTDSFEFYNVPVYFVSWLADFTHQQREAVSHHQHAVPQLRVRDAGPQQAEWPMWQVSHLEWVEQPCDLGIQQWHR